MFPEIRCLTAFFNCFFLFLSFHRAGFGFIEAAECVRVLVRRRFCFVLFCFVFFVSIGTEIYRVGSAWNCLDGFPFSRTDLKLETAAPFSSQPNEFRIPRHFLHPATLFCFHSFLGIESRTRELESNEKMTPLKTVEEQRSSVWKRKRLETDQIRSNSSFNAIKICGRRPPRSSESLRLVGSWSISFLFLFVFSCSLVSVSRLRPSPHQKKKVERREKKIN